MTQQLLNSSKYSEHLKNRHGCNYRGYYWISQNPFHPDLPSLQVLFSRPSLALEWAGCILTTQQDLWHGPQNIKDVPVALVTSTDTTYSSGLNCGLPVYSQRLQLMPWHRETFMFLMCVCLQSP